LTGRSECPCGSPCPMAGGGARGGRADRPGGAWDRRPDELPATGGGTGACAAARRLVAVKHDEGGAIWRARDLRSGAKALKSRRSGRLAQLVERFVYTEDVGSSSLSSPTIPLDGSGRKARVLPSMMAVVQRRRTLAARTRESQDPRLTTAACHLPSSLKRMPACSLSGARGRSERCLGDAAQAEAREGVQAAAARVGGDRPARARIADRRHEQRVEARPAEGQAGRQVRRRIDQPVERALRGEASDQAGAEQAGPDAAFRGPSPVGRASRRCRARRGR
jgi:hypothetical protein